MPLISEFNNSVVTVLCFHVYAVLTLIRLNFPTTSTQIAYGLTLTSLLGLAHVASIIQLKKKTNFNIDFLFLIAIHGTKNTTKL